MNRRDGVHLGPALRQLGPLTALGCSFVLGGVLGSLMVSLIVGQAAQELESFLRDYLSAAQAGEIQARFWPMLWEQGRFLIGLCILGVTALGVAGIPVLFLARGFLFSFSVAAKMRAAVSRGVNSVTSRHRTSRVLYSGRYARLRFTTSGSRTPARMSPSSRVRRVSDVQTRATARRAYGSVRRRSRSAQISRRCRTQQKITWS